MVSNAARDDRHARATLDGPAINKLARRNLRAFDRRFYFWAWVAAFIAVFAGFARSYFLRPFFHRSGLPLLLHAHGLIMTSWLALFFTQVLLIAAHRMKWHRRLGVFGAVLAALAWIVGSIVLVHAVARHANGHTALFLKLLVAFDGLNLTVFAGLVAGAIVMRRRPDYHKRLMLLATLALLPPAVGRISEIFGPHSAVAVLLSMIGSVLVAVGVDTFLYQRLHAAFAWGALIVIASNLITYVA